MNGLLYVPLLGAWLAFRAVLQLPRDRWLNQGISIAQLRKNRFYAVFSLAVVLACAGLVLAVFLHYKASSTIKHVQAVKFLETTVRVLSAGLGGRAAAEHQPYVGIVAVIMTAGAVYTAVRVVLLKAEEPVVRLRALTTLVLIVAACGLIAAVAYGRSALWTNAMHAHFSTLAEVALVAAYLSYSLNPSANLQRFVPALLLVGLLSWNALYFRSFHLYSVHHNDDLAKMRSDFQSGASATQIAEHYNAVLFFIDSPKSRAVIQGGIVELRRAGFGLYGPPDQEEITDPSAIETFFAP
jgi:hypothetical protein